MCAYVYVYVCVCVCACVCVCVCSSYGVREFVNTGAHQNVMEGGFSCLGGAFQMRSAVRIPLLLVCVAPACEQCNKRVRITLSFPTCHISKDQSKVHETALC